MIAPNIALGQNFFNNESLAVKIGDLATASNPETIIEIGPGTGVFTKIFNSKADHLILIEKDARLASVLSALYPNSEVFNEDLTQINFNEIASFSKLSPDKTIVYGSLPYNQSKPIIEICLTSIRADEFYFIIQKEVADHYAAQKGNPFALYASLFASPKKLLNISPGSFTPKPKVDSALIYFKRNSLSESVANLPSFKRFLATAFTAPRKKLSNNLKSYKKPLPPEFAETRPDQLSTVDFIRLWDIISNNEKS